MPPRPTTWISPTVSVFGDAFVMETDASLPRVECTAARDIVPFKEDVTKLRRNVIDLHIVRHLLVDIFVKKIVRSLCAFWNRIAIAIDRDDRRAVLREDAIRIRAAIRVEFLRGRNLVCEKLLIPRDLLLPVDGSLFLLVDHFAFGIDGRTIILRHVRIDRITVVSIVLRDRIAVRLRAGIGCLLTASPAARYADAAVLYVWATVSYALLHSL